MASEAWSGSMKASGKIRSLAFAPSKAMKYKLVRGGRAARNPTSTATMVARRIRYKGSCLIGLMPELSLAEKRVRLD